MIYIVLRSNGGPNFDIPHTVPGSAALSINLVLGTGIIVTANFEFDNKNEYKRTTNRSAKRTGPA